jgi:hypothetical protein
VRPIYYEPAPQRAEIELQPAAGGDFKTVATVSLYHSTCYFDKDVHFPSAGNVRIAWTYPGGPTIYSREVAITTDH